MISEKVYIIFNKSILSDWEWTIDLTAYSLKSAQEYVDFKFYQEKKSGYKSPIRKIIEYTKEK